VDECKPLRNEAGELGRLQCVVCADLPPAVAEGHTLVHFSVQPEHYFWGTFGNSSDVTAQVELRSGRVEGAYTRPLLA